jgi:hypothetical protein
VGTEKDGLFPLPELQYDICDQTPAQGIQAAACRGYPLFPSPVRACSLARAWLRDMLPAR